MQEYEDATLKQASKSNKTITLDDSMFGVLSQYADMFQSRSAKAAPTRFCLPPKKRRRPTRKELPELQAIINPQSFSVVQQKTRLKL